MSSQYAPTDSEVWEWAYHIVDGLLPKRVDELDDDLEEEDNEEDGHGEGCWDWYKGRRIDRRC